MRKRYTIILIILAVVAGIALGGVIWQKSLTRWVTGILIQRFVDRMIPKDDFTAMTPPLMPDYRDIAQWATRPERLGAAGLTPDNRAPLAASLAKADVFYVHPTTFVGNYGWNAATDDRRPGEIVDEFLMAGQAGVFNQCCRIYAPRYRQANLSIFFNDDDNAKQALSLAYSDVRRAFEYYLEHLNDGRPFILASHSQGTLHASRLLEDIVLNTPLQSRLVAAYLIGYRLPAQKLDDAWQSIYVCSGAAQSGCLISYDTFSESIDPYGLPDSSMIWHKGGWIRLTDMGPQKIGINPVSGTVADTTRSEHLGIVRTITNNEGAIGDLFNPDIVEPFGLKVIELKKYLPGVSGHLDVYGQLLVDRPDHDFLASVDRSGVYHVYDYGLFYMNLRVDVARRLDTYLEAN